MLTGKALDYYYQSVAPLNLQYEEILAQLNAYFHTSENYQLFLNEWRTVMLKDVIASNHDKDLSQCLELLIDKLHRIYQAMAQHNGLSESSLTGQLVSACQGVEACSTVLI
jgi:lysyl-tRNA synthetase class I